MNYCAEILFFAILCYYIKDSGGTDFADKDNKK